MQFGESVAISVGIEHEEKCPFCPLKKAENEDKSIISYNRKR